MQINNSQRQKQLQDRKIKEGDDGSERRTDIVRSICEEKAWKS